MSEPWTAESILEVMAKFPPPMERPVFATHPDNLKPFEVDTSGQSALFGVGIICSEFLPKTNPDGTPYFKRIPKRLLELMSSAAHDFKLPANPQGAQP